MKLTELEFTQLVQQHKGTIYTVCFMFAEDAAEADDLFQDVLVNLWRGLKDFRAESAEATWVWRVALNTCISQQRKKRKRNFVSLSMESNFFEDNDEEARQVRLLHERIHRLQPFDRAIVLLWLENLSYEDIAAIVGITVKNVSVRLVRIREQLKRMSNPE